MPELPDLVYIEKRLNQYLPGKAIKRVIVKEPVVFRILTPGGLAELTGRKFGGIHRHGPFLVFKFEGEIELVIHPMLAGRLQFIPQSQNPARARCCTFVLDDGNALHYLDDKRMGKIYLVQAGDYPSIPRFLQQGSHILSTEFTFEKFENLMRKRRHQVRVFLMDQTALSAIGNAYADEILFEAQIHPKTLCSQLSSDQQRRLFESIKNIIKWGIDEVEKSGQPIEIKVRQHMRVRNRKDQPCPRCGTTIRRAGVLGHDAFFCPNCQPTRRKTFIDWN